MTAAEITHAIHNLHGVAQTCSYVEEAVHFYGTQKDALGEDIDTILDHVAALERENAELRKQSEIDSAVIGKAHAEIIELRADKARLDWLALHDDFDGLDNGGFKLKIYCYGKDFRAAIDQARSQ